MNEPPVSMTDHTAQVLSTFEAAHDARLRDILESAVRHLHAFVAEVGLTREEWALGIEFLTEVGRWSDESRNEFVLLSDTLGVSMLVELISQAPEAGCTEPTVLGPFYVQGAPQRALGESIAAPGTVGDDLVIRGQVRGADGPIVGGAVVEVWETQPDGRYDVQCGVGKTNMRGSFTTDGGGRYEIHCLRPVDYCITDDGPVGDLLRSAGRLAWRPAHIHFMVRADGYKTLTTHLFDVDSPWLSQDAVFAVRPSLVTDMASGTATFDIVLEPDPAGSPNR